MANPLKIFKRKRALVEEIVVSSLSAAEMTHASLTEKWPDATVVTRQFKVGPRPYSRPGVTKQGYNWAIRVYKRPGRG